MTYDSISRREDLEDMLADPAYFQAIFHTLSKAKELYHSQAEIGLANETIASCVSVNQFWSCLISRERLIRSEPGSPRRAIQTTVGDEGCIRRGKVIRSEMGRAAT
jgi:hypothetical protein